MTTTAEITVMMSAAFKEAYLELLPEFERATGHKVVTLWVPSADILGRLEGGGKTDLVIVSATAIDELIRRGQLAAGSRVDLAKSGVAVAVRAGAPRPDISSGEALKRALLAARSIAYSTGPSGVYLVGLFQRMGVAEAIKSKIKQVKGEPVGAVVARGDAEIGFQQMSELLPISGIDVLGPLSADVQQITTFAAGLHVRARAPVEARALARFLSAPAAAPVIRKKGMEPA